MLKGVLTGELLLLLLHRGRVRGEKGESVLDVPESIFVLGSRLPIADDPACVVQSLQG